MKVTSEELDRRMARFRKVLRDVGVKVTPQRIEIYREVARTDEHPSAETIFQRVRSRMPTVSRDTVYRTLSLLEKLGLVSRLHAVFEGARFDANMEPHHHFICGTCGMMHDVRDEKLDSLAVSPEISRLGVIDSIRVHMWGTCCNCLLDTKTQDNMGQDHEDQKNASPVEGGGGD